MGQSPRARGRQKDTGRIRDGKGAIPAGAGETRFRCEADRPCGGNPRGRGGDGGRCGIGVAVSGQSPRARGRPEGFFAAALKPRAIPAGAGETLNGIQICNKYMGNPRGRGGDALGIVVHETKKGQSPRARGRLLNPWNPMCVGGAIPAGAGETVIGITSIPEPGGNPRGRGGDRARSQRPRARRGQSPRARGRPCDILPQIEAGPGPLHSVLKDHSGTPRALIVPHEEEDTVRR